MIAQRRLNAVSDDIMPYLEGWGYHYVKIRPRPWNGIDLQNSVTPEPRGKTKLKMLGALLDIYDSWKIQLDKAGQPYYLKIWLFEPRFRYSQVVCAVGGSIDYYNNLFFEADRQTPFDAAPYGHLQERVAGMRWEARADDDVEWGSEYSAPGEPITATDWRAPYDDLVKLLRKPHKKSVHEGKDGAIDMYRFEKGIVWIGGD